MRSFLGTMSCPRKFLKELGIISDSILPCIHIACAMRFAMKRMGEPDAGGAESIVGGAMVAIAWLAWRMPQFYPGACKNWVIRKGTT